MAHRQTQIFPRRLLVASFVCIPLLVVLPLLVWAQAGSVDKNSELLVLSSDDRGVLLELRVSDYQLEPAVGDSSLLQVQALGLPDRVNSLGAPDLPAWSTLLAIPPGTDVQVRIVGADSQVDQLGNLIQPQRDVLPVEEGETWAGADSGLRSEVYQQDAFFPASQVVLGEPFYYRDQRLVRLTLHPLRVNSVRGQLEHTDRLQVQVDFVGKAKLFSSTALVSNPETEQLLKDTVLNYEQGRAWRGLPAAFRAPESSLEIGVPAYKIEVDEDGIYRVTYSDLLTAGMEVSSVNPISLSLSSQGQPVAIELIGDGDSDFELGEGFYFYGQRFRGTVMEEKYTDVNVYWLTVSDSAGLHMEAVDGTPGDAPAVLSYRATEYQEQDWYWNAGRTIAYGDQETWYWDRKIAESANPPTNTIPIPVTSTHTVELSALVAEPFLASVQVKLFSEGRSAGSDDRHWVQAYLNGQLFDEQGQNGEWIYIEPRLFSGTISSTDLISGSNQLEWVLLWDEPLVPWSGYAVYMDWFQVEYQRRLVAQSDRLTFGGDVSGTFVYSVNNFSTDDILLWDITQPLSPTRVENAAVSASAPYTLSFEAQHPADSQFVAVGEGSVSSPLSVTKYLPPDLDPIAGADWIAISHADFITETQRLADFRASRGMRTVVVDVADLYNQYSYGIYQPAAIHDYLSHALEWPGSAPAFALLVGDGHWNFKQVPGYSPDEPIFIPPYLAFVDPYQGEVPADNFYALLVGDDPVPDIALGRLPVQTITQTRMLVDKIVDHEHQLTQTLPAWRYQAVFLADDPDDAGQFHDQSEAAIAYLPDYMNPIRIYYGVEPYTITAATRQAVVDAFNGGAHFYNYRGHGSLRNWAGNSLFHANYIPSLTNTNKLPVVLTMDCLDGYFSYPGNQAVSEELIRYADGGSVGHWGSSGLGLSSDHSILHEAFFESLYGGGASRFGQAAVGSKLSYAVAGGQMHNLHTFTLFGDPAMRLLAADLELEVDASADYLTPGDLLTYSLHITNTGPADLSNVELVDVLPNHTTFEDAWGTPWAFDGSVITWTFSLDAGQDEEVYLQVQIAALTQNTLISNDDYGAQADFAASVPGAPVLSWAAPPPTASFDVSDLMPALGQQVYFTSTSTVYGSPSYQWDFGDGVGTAVGPTAVYTYTGDDAYTVVLQVSDEYGMDSDQQVVTPLWPQLALVKSAPVAVALDEVIRYTLTVTNVGLVSAENIQLIDPVPANTRFYSATLPYELQNSITVTWDLPDLAPGEHATVILTVEPEQGVALTVANQNYSVSASFFDTLYGPSVNTDVDTRFKVLLPLVLQ